MDWFGGRVAVITGAAHGIGEATARRLAALGARVVAVDIDGPALEQAFGDGSATPVVGDLAGGRPAALAASLIERFGPIELLVNNVGIDTPQGFVDLDEEQFDHVFGANLKGPWFFTRAIVADLIRRNRSGAIVFVSSLHDHVVRRLPHYSASKAAVAMLVRELAYELGPRGIRVNAVSPGVILSAKVPEPSAEEADRLRELVRLGGRPGLPDDVARMAAVLLSDEWARHVTGVNVPVDGGLGLVTWSAAPPGPPRRGS